MNPGNWVFLVCSMCLKNDTALAFYILNFEKFLVDVLDSNILLLSTVQIIFLASPFCVTPFR